MEGWDDDVRFFDGPEELVFPEDVKYGRAHSFDRSDGDWVLVLMRGYAQREVRRSLAGAIQRSTLIPVYAKPVALSWLDQSGLLLVAYDRAIRSVVNQDGIMNKAALKQALATQLSIVAQICWSPITPTHCWTMTKPPTSSVCAIPGEITLVRMAFSHSHLRPFFGLMSFTPTPNDRPSRDLRGALAAYLGQQRTSAFVCRNLR